MFLLEEAEICRGLAAAFEGKAESSFLQKAAQAFEELAMRGAPWQVTRQSNNVPGERIRLL